MVDESGFEAIQQSALECQKAVVAGKWIDALRLWGATQHIVKDKSNGIDW